jgi:maltose/moltooligosaccharide transporter
MAAERDTFAATSMLNAQTPIAAGNLVGASKTYRCGTLTYTKATLISLFLWLLWGDFVFVVMEAVVPSIVPLKLNSLGASNTTIGTIMVTVTGVMNMIMTPVVSFKSDRYRSRWGRRIPFLIWPTPFVFVFLIGLGFSPELSQRLFNLCHGAYSLQAISIWLIASLMVCFQFFNMFVTSVYWYLFNDVVPAQFLGRFMALFRAVGSCAGGLYSFAAAPFAETHSREIFIIAGVAYLIVFGMMCLRIREGDYPAPAPEAAARESLFGPVRTYLRECFSHRLYWLFYLTNACWAVAYVVNTFQVFFFQSVGASTETYFRTFGAGQWLTIPFLLIGGYFVDRHHPLRIQMIALLALIVLTPVQLVFLFFKFSPAASSAILVAGYLVSIPLFGLYQASEIPMFMRLLPRSRYGTFSSSNALLRAFTTIIGGFLAGAFIDMAGKYTARREDAFLYVPLWTLVFQILSAISLLMLFKTWKRHGGDQNYSPPGFESESNEAVELGEA